MPGYLTDPASYASGIAITASGNISAPNVQSAIYELDSEKAPSSGIAQSAITNLVSDLSAKAPLASPTFTGTVSASVANVSSNLTVDTNTLFVDATNNRVGIGVATPNSKLHIKQDVGINDAVKIEGANGGGALIYRNEADGALRIDATQQSFSDISFRNTPSGGSLTERMRIDSSGRITMPYQPMFMARGTSATTGGTNREIAFSTVDLNIGSHYNSTNGRFTAPISGNYFFEFHIFATPGARYLATLNKNGSSIQEYTQEQPTGGNSSQGYGSLDGKILLPLATNDYVTVSTISTIIGSATNYTSFSGFLVG